MNDDSAHKPVKAYAISMKPPEGFEFVPNTAKLTRGTKLQACYHSSWPPLTTISENSDGTINVRWDKFKVKAEIVTLAPDAVTLMTEKGKEATLQISKLNGTDQEFLRAYQSAENPFGYSFVCDGKRQHKP